MKIFFEQKKPGRSKQNIVPVGIEIDGRPETVGQLIEATVRSIVAAFNKRASSAPEDADADTSGKFVDDESLADMAETGRVAFGIVYNGRTADAEKAVANALQSYEDGLFRIFLNGTPLGDAGTTIDLNTGDLLTVVRLTLLSGRLW